MVDPSKSASFQIVDSHSQTSSIKDNPNKSESASDLGLLGVMIGKKGKGKSRTEAIHELNIKPIEMLSTGELKLPSGRVILHRDYWYIQK